MSAIDVIKIKNEIKEEAEEDPFGELDMTVKNESETEDDIDDKIKIEHIKLENIQNRYGSDKFETMKNGHQCKLCDKPFYTAEDLINHYILPKRVGRITHFCCVCHKTFKGKNPLFNHHRSHTGDRPSECGECKKRFCSEGNLKKHQIQIHGNERRFKCDDCDRTFKQLGHLQEHKTVHSDEMAFQCEFCDAGFRTITSYRRHRKRHVQSVVTSKKFSCPICKTQFTKALLKKHLDNHEGPFICRDCDIKFETVHENVEHVKSVHTKRILYACLECKQSFSKLRALRDHIRNNHSNHEHRQCKICGKLFSNSTNMRRHMILHTEQKPFKCEFCQREFTEQGNFKRHMVVHSDERAFVCTICGNSYKHNSSLKDHLMMHSGKKPHACRVCGRTYAILNYLYSHIRTRHGEVLKKCQISDLLVKNIDEVEQESINEEAQGAIFIKDEPQEYLNEDASYDSEEIPMKIEETIIKCDDTF